MGPYPRRATPVERETLAKLGADVERAVMIDAETAVVVDLDGMRRAAEARFERGLSRNVDGRGLIERRGG